MEWQPIIEAVVGALVAVAVGYARKAWKLQVSEAQERQLRDIALDAVSNAQRRAMGGDRKREHAERLIKEEVAARRLPDLDRISMIELVENAVDRMKAPTTGQPRERASLDGPPPLPSDVDDTRRVT